jgi:hypothetical protein
MEGRLILISIGILGLAATSGCAGGGETAPKNTEPSTPTVFTGQIEGTDARVAAVATATHARLYFCGGDSSYETLSRWVPADIGKSGALAPDEASAMGWVIQGTLRDGVLSGSLVAGDAGSYSFDAKPVDDRTLAGLYEATSDCGKVGVIVSQPSTKDTPQAQGACISNGTVDVDIHQVNPVTPLVKDAKGAIRVTVEGITGEISVVAASAPGS